MALWRSFVPQILTPELLVDPPSNCEDLYRFSLDTSNELVHFFYGSLDEIGIEGEDIGGCSPLVVVVAASVLELLEGESTGGTSITIALLAGILLLI